MRVGVLGSGQLGKMLALAGIPIGLKFVFFGPDPDPCVRGLGKLIIGDFNDEDKLAEFVSDIDVATPESEHIPISVLKQIEAKVPVYANAEALAVAQNRLKEKNFLDELNIPVASYTPVKDVSSLEQLLRDKTDRLLSKPASKAMMVKARRF